MAISEITKELNEATKKEITQSRIDIKKGFVYTLDQVKKKAGI